VTTLPEDMMHDALLDGLLDGLVEAVKAGDDPELVQIMRENILNYFAVIDRSAREARGTLNRVRCALQDALR
jgi:DNA-binding GntR family transcriptional regulator